MEMRRQWLDWSMSCIYLMRQAKIGRLRFKRRLAREASILSILKSCWDARSVSQVANYTWTLSRNLQQQSYYFWLDTLFSLTGFFVRFEFPKPSKDARKVAARLHVFCRCQWVFRWMCKLLHASGPGGRCPNTRHTSQFFALHQRIMACLFGRTPMDLEANMMMRAAIVYAFPAILFMVSLVLHGAVCSCQTLSGL